MSADTLVRALFADTDMIKLGTADTDADMLKLRTADTDANMEL